MDIFTKGMRLNKYFKLFQNPKFAMSKHYIRINVTIRVNQENEQAKYLCFAL